MITAGSKIRKTTRATHTQTYYHTFQLLERTAPAWEIERKKIYAAIVNIVSFQFFIRGSRFVPVLFFQSPLVSWCTGNVPCPHYSGRYLFAGSNEERRRKEEGMMVLAFDDFFVPPSLLLLSYCASLSYASGIESNEDDDDDNNGRNGW